MTNAILRGKPDAGNPHVRFDEGEVASEKPRRGSLLYKKLMVAVLACAVGANVTAKTWEWSQSAPGAADYDTGANWVGGVAPANYSASFLGNQDDFVFTNELSALQTINLGYNNSCYWYGCQFGSITLDRYHRLATPKAARLTIGDASKMEGFIVTSGGTQNNSSANVGPFLVIGAGRTNRLAQAMVQNYAWLGRYGDDVGGVAEFGKLFGHGTFKIGDENSGQYKLLGTPSYLFDAFQTGVQGHLRAGARAPAVIRGRSDEAAIATGAYLHLDASAEATVDDDFTWHDANGGPVVANPVGAPAWGTSTNGLAAIVLDGGAAFELSEDITGVQEVFLVFRDTDPGQNRTPPPLLGDYTGVGNFARNTTKNYEYLFASGTAATKGMDAGEVWYDGTRVLPDFCGSFGGQFHVVSVMLYGSTGVVGCLGAAKKNAASADRGKVAFAEVLVYRRMLTDAERRATNKYLRKKWQSADLAYDWDLGSYNVFGGNGSDGLLFEAGTTAIRELGFRASQTAFVKKGEGRLEVGRIINKDLSLTVEGGSLAIVRPEAPVVCEMAPDPIAWLDPSYEPSLTSDASDETRVSKMIDRRNRNNKTGQLPTAANAKNWNVDGISPKRVTDTPTGCQALDFGPAATSAATFGGKSSRMNITGYPILREGFVVWKKNADACGAPFSDNSWNFFGVTSDKIIDASYCSGAAVGGYWTINGEAVAGPSVSLPTGEYMVVGLRPSSAFTCSYLGSQRGNGDTSGACSYGEMILYDRILTPEERRNTEAYLMKKWLNRDHPMAKTAMNVPTYTIAAGAENTIETDVDMTVGSLASAHGGTFTKKGKGKLETNLPLATTAVAVEGGELEGSDAITDLFRDASIHFDASDEASFTFETGSDTKIARWNDARSASGLSTVNARLDTETNVTNAPERVEVEINGVSRTVVDFNERCLADWQNAAKTGANICTNRGSRLKLYTGDSQANQNSQREFYIVRRDTESETTKRVAILAASPYVIDRYQSEAFNYMTFKINNVTYTNYTYTVDAANVAYNTKIDTQWHVHCLTLGADKTYTLRYLGGDQTTGYQNYYGGLQIAEVISFQQPRSAAERQAIIDYLRKKWMGAGDGATKTYASVTAAPGANLALDVAGWSAVGATKLSGGGTVDFGVPVTGIGEIAGAVGADGTAQPLTVSSAVTLAATGVVKVTCPNARLKAGVYPILSATPLANPEVLADWTLELSVPLCRTARLAVRNNAVCLEVLPNGLLMIVR